MSVPRREYDSKRRPNTFYKGDPASDNELQSRSYERGQNIPKPTNIAEEISESIGYGMARNSADHVSGGTVGKKGKSLNDVSIIEPTTNTSLTANNVKNVPISGTLIGKTKGMFK